MSTATYTVTYTFDTATNAASDDLVTRLDDVATRLRRDGVPIEFRGGIQRIDADGRVVEMTARFNARTKGTVGRLNCHGGYRRAGRRPVFDSNAVQRRRRSPGRPLAPVALATRGQPRRDARATPGANRECDGF